MNNMLKLALGAVIGVGLVAPAVAQNFPDVPENHWAHEALRNLKDKVLFGYPDGLYRGNRPLSRYEFAVAVNQLYQMMMNKDAGLQDQIDALKRMVEGMKPGADNSAQLAELNGQLEALRRQVSTNTTDIAALRRLMDEFRKEMTALGVDVDKAKKDIADLDSRVKALEARKPAVDIHGDVNLLILAGAASSNRFGMLETGTVVGVGRGSYAGQPVGMTRDLSVAHEAAFNISGTNDSGPKWNATLVAGNVLGLLGSQSAPVFGNFNDTAAPNEFYFQNLEVKFDSSIFGQGFNATLGRTGYQVGKYLLERPDFHPYYANERWDNGNWMFDGGVMNLKFGSAKLNLFGGRTNAAAISTGNQIQGQPGGTNRILGADLGFALGSNGDLKAAYLMLDRDLLAGGNRQNVYGFEANYKVSDVALFGAWSKSQFTNNTTNVPGTTTENQAWEISAKYNKEKWGLKGGYRRVEGNFFTIGSWGRIGTAWNPTGFEGFNAGIWFKPNQDVKLYAKAEFAKGLGGTFVGSLGLPATNDRVNTFTLGLDYKLSDTMSLMASYEDVRFDYNVGTDPTQRWYTLGLNWNMSSNAMMSFMYKYSDVDFKGRVGLDPFGANRYTGSMFGTQLSIKF